MSKQKPSNRRKRFSGSTLRIEQRIINGRGRSYLRKLAEQRALSKAGGFSLDG